MARTNNPMPSTFNSYTIEDHPQNSIHQESYKKQQAMENMSTKVETLHQVTIELLERLLEDYGKQLVE